MKRTLIRALLAGLCGMLAACAIITVNVYFPEKAVKEAYKSLDEMLLQQGEEKPAPEGRKPAGESPAPVPGSQSRLLDRFPSLSLVGEACAAENYADQLAIEIAGMPEVLAAYDEMKARLPQLDALRDRGIVGETSQGLVTVHDKGKATPQDEALVRAENANRKLVITAMAKAILKLNKQPESKEGLGQVLPKAAATYADAKREAAKPGWWIQLQNGRWVQK